MELSIPQLSSKPEATPVFSGQATSGSDVMIWQAQDKLVATHTVAKKIVELDVLGVPPDIAHANQKDLLAYLQKCSLDIKGNFLSITLTDPPLSSLEQPCPSSLEKLLAFLRASCGMTRVPVAPTPEIEEAIMQTWHERDHLDETIAELATKHEAELRELEQVKTEKESKLAWLRAELERIGKKAHHLKKNMSQMIYPATPEAGKLITFTPKTLSQAALSAESVEDPAISIKQRLAAIEADLKIINESPRAILNQNLRTLFELDGNNPNGPIRQFYFNTVRWMTAFSAAVLALSSGKVERSKEMTDSIASGIFAGLQATVGILGTSTAPFGAIIPALGKPIVIGAQLGWDQLRNRKKQKEFAQASDYYKGGYEEIDLQNKFIALKLAYLLQMQIPLCTTKGAQAIVIEWLYRLSSDIMTGQKITDEEAENIAVTLFRLGRSKLKNYTIETTDPTLKWKTRSLFKRSGIAYMLDQSPHYESCFRQKGDKTIRVTRADKYGYFFFFSPEEALQHQHDRTKKEPQDSDSIYWQRDDEPLGPKISTMVLAEQVLSNSLSEMPTKVAEKVLDVFKQFAEQLERLNEKVEVLNTRVTALERPQQ